MRCDFSKESIRGIATKARNDRIFSLLLHMLSISIFLIHFFTENDLFYLTNRMFICILIKRLAKFLSKE